MKRLTGKFITIEGVEGVGKSTNVAFVEQFLQQRQQTVVRTREPGGTPFAEEVREILLRKREEKVDSCAELLLVFAARSQHVNAVILPALARGEWVLCDRFTDATFAYQGAGRGMSASLIAQLESVMQESLETRVQPDLTLLLDLDVEVGLNRARQRGELDRFESEDVAFFQRVRQGYLARAAAAPERYHIVDASMPLETVQGDIVEGLEKLL